MRKEIPNAPRESIAYVSGREDVERALVVVFLRGAADGLSLVPPREDDDYFRARPTLGVAKQEAVRLDDAFGLNPEMLALDPLFREGTLAVLHGTGSEDETRSHFEAQDFMEHGGLAPGGWLGRFLRFQADPADGPLAAVALGSAMPESLRGAPGAAVMRSPADFRLRGKDPKGFMERIERLYAEEAGELGQAARDAMKALRKIEELGGAPDKAENGAIYPAHSFGDQLRQVARLVRARVGLRAATIDLGGWDSHFAQSNLINPLMRTLAEGLAAFRKDLGADMDGVTVVTMSEFGRRVAENSALGTDHGRGGVAFVMGGGVAGGRVYADWRGLAPDKLDGPGDVPVTINYRDMLAPILARHGAADLARVFPDYELNPLKLYS